MNSVEQTLLYPPPVIWPLCFLLAFFVVYREWRHDVRPIVQVIVRGVAQSAGNNSIACAIAFAFGLSASMSAFYDVFSQLDAKSVKELSWHQYAALWTKVLNPFVVAVLAYFTKSFGTKEVIKLPDNETKTITVPPPVARSEPPSISPV